MQLSRGDPRQQTRNCRRNGPEPKRRLADQGVRGHGDLFGVSVEQLKLDRVDLIIEPEVPEKTRREEVGRRAHDRFGGPAIQKGEPREPQAEEGGNDGSPVVGSGDRFR